MLRYSLTNFVFICWRIAGSFTYEQIGPDIDGEAEGDNFGNSVCISGDGATFIAGAPYSDGNGPGSGHVRVYNFSATVGRYAQVGSDIDGTKTYTYFGGWVSLSRDGTTFLETNFLSTSNKGQEYAGRVSVYKFDRMIGRYVKVGSDIYGEAPFDNFGTSVSISGNGTIFVVGAPGNDGNGCDSGRVLVYKFDAAVSSYKRQLEIHGEAAADRFGSSVSISADGTTFIVGTPFSNGNGSKSGHVRVYQFDATIGSYAQVGSDINGKSAGDYFGASVRISGDGSTFVEANSYRDFFDFLPKSHARVYRFNSTIGSYAQVGPEINGFELYNSMGYSQFMSITSDGTTFVLGSQFNESLGQVCVYKLNSTIGSYVQVGSNIYGEAYGDDFGRSVSITDDGNTFVVGAYGSDANGFNSGHVRVYSTTRATLSPTMMPVEPPIRATVSPTMMPVEPPTTCGLFGLNLFCPRRGKCGLIRRLWKINGCQ